MNPDLFQGIVNNYLNRLELGFKGMLDQNHEGHLVIKRLSPFELLVGVDKVGPYKFWADPQSQHLVM